MTGKDDYCTIRIKSGTKDMLSELKEAYQITYGRPFTFDGVVKQMAASVEDGDVAVWELYCLRQSQREEMERKALEIKERG